MTEFDSVSYRAKFAVCKDEIKDVKFMLKRNEVVYLRPQSVTSRLIVNNGSARYKRIILPETPLLIFCRKRMELSFEKEWLIETMPANRLATLMAFAEYEQQSAGKSQHSKPLKALTGPYAEGGIQLQSDDFLIVGISNKITTVMDILLKCSDSQNCLVPEVVFQTIRNDEGYWLARFLLSQVVNSEFDLEPKKLTHACKEYGVSQSYFRKMCHHTFTRAPKQQMKIWRAAHSALQLIENDESIATVAAKNGYSSSSHFSVEIKKYFGITPREFRRLEGFLNE